MNLDDLRMNMVKEQIQSRGIDSADVKSAMALVHREFFVPKELRHLSYIDGPLPIDCSQTISQPYVIAYMIDMLGLKSSDRVLEIGTGSGYNAAVLSEIVSQVYTIEIIPHLATKAQQLLYYMGYTNIHVSVGDGRLGLKEEAPFDAIIVTAATKTVPQNLLDQLTDSGRLILPLGDIYQSLYLYTKEEGRVYSEKLLPVRFVPLVEQG